MNAPRVELFQYDLPLIRPFALRAGQITHRQGLVLRLNIETATLGEIAPLPGVSAETLDEARAAAVKWCETVCTRRTCSRDTLAETLRTLPNMPSLCFGIGCAVEGPPTRKSDHADSQNRRVFLNGLIAGDRDEAVSQAQQLRRAYYRAAKLKVGRRSVEEDAEIVRAVREALGPSISLRLDANRAWTYEQALAFPHETRECGIEYIEEPLQDPHRLAEFAHESGMSVALDETVVENAGQEGFLRDHPWVRAVILKPTLLGDMTTVNRLAAEAASCRAKVVVSSCFESGVGIAALAHWASHALESEVPMGLDTCHWLAEDVLDRRPQVDQGAFNLDEISACLATLDVSKMECVFRG